LNGKHSSIASGSYEAYLRSMSPEGLAPESFMEAVIEQQVQALKVTEKVPLGKVADFKILREVLVEPRKGR
jgi:hypothetical protein